MRRGRRGWPPVGTRRPANVRRLFPTMSVSSPPPAEARGFDLEIKMNKFDSGAENLIRPLFSFWEVI